MSQPGETIASRATASNDDASKPAQIADAASSGAADTAATARDGAKDVAGEALTQAKAVAGEARQQVSTLVDQTKGELSKQAQDRTKQAAGGLRALAGQIDALANGRPDESGPLAGLLTEAHGRMSTFAERLESGGPGQLAGDVSNFARRRPIVFLAATVGAGFLVGRLARAGRAAVQDTDAAPPELSYAGLSTTSPSAIGSRSTTVTAPLDAPAAPLTAPPVVTRVP